MANNRDTSKQKRARQNRAQREALQARTKAASEAPEVRRSKATAAPAAKGGKGAKGAAPAKVAPVRPLRPGDTPVDLETLEGSFFSKRMAVPGGRQVLWGALLTVVMTVIMVVMYRYPVAAPKGSKVKIKTSDMPTLFEKFGSGAFLILAIPLVIAAIAVVFTLSPRRRRIWQICAYVLALCLLLRADVYLNYLVVVGFYIYALWRASKIEGRAPNSFAARSIAKAEAKAAAKADAAGDPDPS